MNVDELAVISCSSYSVLESRCAAEEQHVVSSFWIGPSRKLHFLRIPELLEIPVSHHCYLHLHLAVLRVKPLLHEVWDILLVLLEASSLVLCACRGKVSSQETFRSQVVEGRYWTLLLVREKTCTVASLVEFAMIDRMEARTFPLMDFWPLVPFEFNWSSHLEILLLIWWWQYHRASLWRFIQTLSCR